MVFLGDQVYADDTSPAMKEFIESRRDPSEPPWDELKDYEEYAHLYQLAWSDPANRWLLSTLPSAMIFDDHDIRDDWNTSWTWRQEMEATDWWHERVVAGLGSYWVYQHLGNLGAEDRADDKLWRLVADHDGPATTSSTSPSRSTSWPTAPTRSPRRTAGASRATSTTRPASWSSTPGRPACSSRTAARCSTTARWPGSTSGCAATSTTSSSARRCRC